MIDIDILKELSNIAAPSSYEIQINKYIEKQISDYTDDLYYDKMGNLIARIGNDPKIMYCAHSDEIGFVVKGISDDGFIIIDSIGGIDPKYLVSKKLKFENGRIGIVLTVPIHFKRNNGNTDIKMSDLRVDIGERSYESAKKVIKIGDFAVFDTEFKYLNEESGIISGKALDNRIGAYILIHLIRCRLINNAYFVFTVQEETGSRGASVVSNSLNFELGVAIDTTTAFDVPDAENMNSVAKIGYGAVISFVDGATVYDNSTVKRITERFDKKNIQYQIKTFASGGNDASSIQKSGIGHTAVSISTPARSIHSPISVASINDIESMIKTSVEISQMKNEGLI